MRNYSLKFYFKGKQVLNAIKPPGARALHLHIIYVQLIFSGPKFANPILSLNFEREAKSD